MPEQVFLDTAYVQALFDKNDPYHAWADKCRGITRNAPRVWITEAIFLEVGAALLKINRTAAAAFVRRCYETTNVTVVPIDHSLLMRSLNLYESRQDKEWSLVDCMSFVVMQDNRLQYAVTTDHHFEQAGFQRIV
jgi:uncharacterized protein